MKAISGYLKFKSILAIYERSLCKGYLKQYIHMGKLTAKEALLVWKAYGFTSWDLF